MSWARVDDGFLDHPKLATLEADPVLWAKAVALWLAGNLYANRNGTDGHIARARIYRLVPFRDAPKVAAALAEFGLWEDCGSYFAIHDFLDYNPSRQDRAEATARKTHRQQKWRARATVDGHVDASTRASVDGAPPRARIPAPPRPVEDQKQKLPSPGEKPPAPGDGSAPALPPTSPPRKARAPVVKKPREPDKPPDPRHAPFVRHFCERWEAVVKSKFTFTGRDAKAVASVLALGDNAEIRRRLDIALCDPFFRKRGQVEQLAAGWNGYAAGPPRPDVAGLAPRGEPPVLAEIEAIKRERAQQAREGEGT